MGTIITQVSAEEKHHLITNLHDLAPHELWERPQVVVWNYEEEEREDGTKRLIKVPKKPWDDPNGLHNASTSRPDTWGTLEQSVWKLLNSDYTGIGFCLTGEDPYACIDLDNAVDPATGAIKPWARYIVDRLDSYTELSPSGTGLHTWVRARLAKALKGGSKETVGVEMYFGGEGKGRYMAMTGQHIPGTPRNIEARQTEVDELYQDQDMLRSMAKHSPKAKALFCGEPLNYPSASEATFELCKEIAYYCGRDPVLIDRLIRQSGFMRPKWDEPRGSGTWGSETIANALLTRAQQTRQEEDRPFGGAEERPQGDSIAEADVGLHARMKEFLKHLAENLWMLDNPEVAALLLSYAETAGTRAWLNRLMRQAKLNPQEMWGIIHETLLASRAEPIISGDDLYARAEDVPTPTWIVDRLLTIANISICSASPKTGKSALVTNLVASVLLGTPFLGRDVAKGGVLWWSFEETREEILTRLYDLGVPRGVELHIRCGSAPASDLWSLLRRDLAQYKPALVIVDPIISLINVEDANQYGEVMAEFNRVRSLLAPTATHLMGVLHDNKASQGFKAMINSIGFRAVGECNIKIDREDVNDPDSKRIIYTEKRNRKAEVIPQTYLDYDEPTGKVWLGDKVNGISVKGLVRLWLSNNALTKGRTAKEVFAGLGGNDVASESRVNAALKLLTEEEPPQVEVRGKDGKAYLYWYVA